MAGGARAFLGMAHSVGWRKVTACRCPVRRYGLVSRNWERKRFYEKAVVYECHQQDCGEGAVFGVSLDHRKLKTPLRNLFLVPSKPVAAAVAQEWEDQQEFIQPTFMHLTLLCNTAIDQPVHKTPEEQVDSILAQLDTDLLRYVCYENDELSRIQALSWTPLLDWFNQSWCREGMLTQLREHHITTIDWKGIVQREAVTEEEGPPQMYGMEVTSEAGLLPGPVSHKGWEAASEHLLTMSKWQLAGFSYSVESCKSVVLSAAMTEGHLAPEQAAELALLEQRFQTERWGRVQWAHDVDQQDMTSRLTAVKVVHSLL